MADKEFPYSTADYQSVPCNLCLGTELELLNSRDRNGLPVKTCICKRCGLIFINPRMTPQWYDQYYQQEYRAQMARFRGKAPEARDEEVMFQRSTRHGVGLATRFKEHWARGLTVEVGSSVGGVLDGIKQTLSVDVLGIEPSPSESKYANEHGIRTFTNSIESFAEPLAGVTNILCTQSLNHFQNPRFFLEWSHANLQDNGRLILEVTNFRHVFRNFRWMPRAIQIDHTYMFVPEVLANFVEFAGFDILAVDSDETKSAAEIASNKSAGLPRVHVRIIAAKTPRKPFEDTSLIKAQYPQVRRSLQEVPASTLSYLWNFGLRKWRKTGKI
jgi:SAM-dependent methyltransferase